MQKARPRGDPRKHNYIQSPQLFWTSTDSFFAASGPTHYGIVFPHIQNATQYCALHVKHQLNATAAGKKQAENSMSASERCAALGHPLQFSRTFSTRCLVVIEPTARRTWLDMWCESAWVVTDWLTDWESEWVSGFVTDWLIKCETEWMSEEVNKWLVFNAQPAAYLTSGRRAWANEWESEWTSELQYYTIILYLYPKRKLSCLPLINNVTKNKTKQTKKH